MPEFSAAVEISPEEASKLEGIFRCEGNELPERLEPFGKAALFECLEILKSPKGRVDEALKNRIYLMTRTTGQLPNELDVKDWAGLTITQARNAIKSVINTHKNDLRPILNDMARDLIGAMRKNGPNWYFETEHHALVEFLDDEISRKDKKASKIQHKKDTRLSYVISNHEYQILEEIATEPF